MADSAAIDSPLAPAGFREPRRRGAAPRDLHRARGAARGRAVRGLPRVPDEGPVLRAVRLRLQPAARLWRPVVVRARRLFRHGELRLGLHGEVLGLDARARDPARDGRRRVPRPRLRGAGHPAAGHLFRHDHAGARPDGVLLLAADAALHRRRGRHPGGAARQALRAARASPTTACSTTSWRRSSSPASCSSTASSIPPSVRC